MDKCIIASATDWTWDSNGYPRKGRSKNQGGTILAVRYLWEQLYGPLAKDDQPDHLCKNRGCINLEHIEIVTKAENNARGHRKLTIEQVREIRNKLNRQSKASIAREYGVSYMTITFIQRGKTWKDEV
jgi:hypothetical protein